MSIFRQLFNAPPAIDVREVTTDATPFVVGSIDVSEGETVLVYVKGSCHNDADITKSASFVAMRTIYRAAAGNVTALHDQHDIANYAADGFAPDITIVPNTGTQRVDVTITGVAATTINWKVRIEHVSVS